MSLFSTPEEHVANAIREYDISGALGDGSAAAAVVIAALRALPVEDRMEAMAMVERRASFDGQTFRRCWTEDYQ